MNNKVVNINKESSLKVIENQLELFSQSIIKKNNRIDELELILDRCRVEKIELARAVAKHYRILVNKKKT